MRVIAVQYRQLVNDIQALGDSLERLNAIVQQYEREYLRPEWRSGAYQADARDTLWPQLTGDFCQTLKECESFLARHGYLENGSSSAFSNLRWWLSADDTVKNLTARLRFHIQKVEFYAVPSQFEAVIRNGRDIQQLRRQVANLERLFIHGVEQSRTLWADVLSPELEAKLELELKMNPPSWSTEGSPWPLKDSFEAFAFHFGRGTVKFNPSAESGDVPDLSQQLDLVKSIWILEKIKQNPVFRDANVDSIWADYMREFEDDLRGQLHRFETGRLQKPLDQQLLELPNSHYIIKSSEKTVADPLEAGLAGPLEEKILQIDLASDTSNRESSLSVFREAESDFRFMTSTRQAKTLLAQYDQDFEVNMDRHRLVPAYANPSPGVMRRHNLLIFNEKGKKPRAFEFPQPTDVKKLQRALTGYRVHHDMPVSRWCIDGLQQPGDVGQGILQLWQFKPLPSLSKSALSQTSDAASSLGSTKSPAPSFGLPKLPSDNLSELPAGEGGTEAPVDFSRWPGFPNALVATDPTRRVSQASTSSVPISPLYEQDRPSTWLSGTTKCSEARIHQPGRTFSNSSKLTTGSRNGNQETYNHSSAASGTTIVTRGSVMSPVRGPRGDGTEFVRAQLPVLVIFTIRERKYSFLHLTRKLIRMGLKFLR